MFAKQALENADLKKKFFDRGATAWWSSPAEVSAFSASEEKRLGDLIRKAKNVAGDYIQAAIQAELHAVTEQQLHADTDPQERPSFGNYLENRLNKTALFQIVHAVPKCSDTGQHNTFSLKNDLRVVGN